MKLKLIVENFIKSPFHTNAQVITVVVLFSYTILAIGSGWGFFGSHRAPNFVSAFAFTFIMAIVFMIYVHEVYDRFIKRYINTNKTTVLPIRFFLGVLVPIGVELIAVELFFKKKGESIFTNTFFDTDFILVTIFILLVNVFYVYANRSQQAKLKTRTTFKKRVIPALKDLAALRGLHRLKLIKEAPVLIEHVNLKDLLIDGSQIACAYKIEGQVEVHYFDQRTAIVNTTISKLHQIQDSTSYFKINPYCFYHRLLIFTFVEVGKSRQLLLTLRHPFNHLVHDRQRYVSQSCSADFKKWIEP